MLVCGYIPHTARLPSSFFIIFIVFYSRTVWICPTLAHRCVSGLMTETNAKIVGSKNVNSCWRSAALDGGLD